VQLLPIQKVARRGRRAAEIRASNILAAKRRKKRKIDPRNPSLVFVGSEIFRGSMPLIRAIRVTNLAEALAETDPWLKFPGYFCAFLRPTGTWFDGLILVIR
jgi:hypothetical protein